MNLMTMTEEERQRETRRVLYAVHTQFPTASAASLFELTKQIMENPEPIDLSKFFNNGEKRP